MNNQLPALDDLLTYRNPLVVKRFSKQFPQYQNEAEKIFQDMLKYLWIGKKHAIDLKNNPHAVNLQFTTVMHKEMIIIDEMWHSFILITKQYADFCDHYFGEFIHHIPEVGEEIDKSHVVDKEAFEKELSLFLSYIYDTLGEETVVRWFGMHLTPEIMAA